MAEMDANDPGIFYCRSKGRLYAPRGYSAHDRFEFCNEKRLKERGLGSSDVLLTCQSLAIQCLNYIAKNTMLIDSLVGIPELVGKEIFDCCFKSGCFDNPTRAKKLISIFDEAYPNSLLVSLSCHGQEEMIKSDLKYFLAFRSLVKIDLSRNNLGNDNAFLSSVWSLPRLEELELSDNDISNVGIRKYTLPCRMFQRNSSNMKVLNLSYNMDLSSDCLQYLQIFKKLNLLVLSNTGVDIDLKLRTFGQELSLQICRKAEHVNKLCPIDSEGWATDLGSLWIERHCKQHALNWSQQHLNKFYSKTNHCNYHEREVKRPRIGMVMTSYHLLHLCREGNLGSDHLSDINLAHQRNHSPLKKNAKPVRKAMELEDEILTIYGPKVSQPKGDISLKTMDWRW